jgi:hypothetical protein
MKFRKYEFEPTKWAELKASIEFSHQLGDQIEVIYNHELIESVVEIGHIVLTDPIFDEDFNVVTDAVLSDKYSIDILWKDQELSSFVPFKIWCDPIGIHSFGASIDADYIEAYNEQNKK